VNQSFNNLPKTI